MHPPASVRPASYPPSIYGWSHSRVEQHSGHNRLATRAYVEIWSFTFTFFSFLITVWRWRLIRDKRWESRSCISGAQYRRMLTDWWSKCGSSYTCRCSRSGFPRTFRCLPRSGRQLHAARLQATTAAKKSTLVPHQGYTFARSGLDVRGQHMSHALCMVCSGIREMGQQCLFLWAFYWYYLSSPHNSWGKY